VGDLLKDATVLTRTIAEEGDDLLNLQLSREQLDERLQRIRALLNKIDALRAEKQELVQELHGLQDESGKLMSLLELGLKEHFGNRSEKLLKFGVKPFHRKKVSREKPKDSGAAPEVSGATPD
jgi:uncharacterized coiled-coil DUF342 family protein